MFPVDELIQDRQDGQVIAYDDNVQREGFHGVHVDYQFREAPR